MKVRTSPNSKFADISSIQRAQIKAGETEIEQEEEDSGNKSDSTLDYILVEQLIKYNYFNRGVIA